MSLERWGKGIDNVHVDVLLAARLGERLRETVRKLILEDVRAMGLGRPGPEQSAVAGELDAFRDSYLAVFEATLARSQAEGSPDLLALFQVSLLKALLQGVARENLLLQDELKRTAHRDEVRKSGQSLKLHEGLVLLTREEHAINRRVLRVLFRQLRRLEGDRLEKLRASLAGKDWPVPESAFYNPVLMVPDLPHVSELAEDYAVALLAENGDTQWLFQTNQCITKVFQLYLPLWTQTPSRGGSAGWGEGVQLSERLDQGQLRGFLETEILLSSFIPRDEYRQGRCSWLDEPQNLRLFLSAGSTGGEAAAAEPLRRRCWIDPRWGDFQRAMIDELYRCLDLCGLTRPVTLLYWLPTIRASLGRSVPLTLVLDYVEGRLSRRRLAQRLEAIRLGPDQVSVSRALERAAMEIKRLPSLVIAKYLDRYLVDFLTLRRDLKLAYKAYETMDGIRLLEDAKEVRLSRSNASLIELDDHDAPEALPRRIRGHAVIKADVRGSTLITEQLCARGLNPASHFSLNFFDPVNSLLPEFGAEKVFVEGDAVILTIFEYDDVAGLAVARACGLARSILQVVALQNALNRKHGLPDLELGLGIAYERQEPSFLYDEGHRIMISGAINRADRLCACAAILRRNGFNPEHPAFRVTVVRDLRAPQNQTGDDDLLNFNVNGIKVDEAAFFKLQKELHLRQVRVPDAEMFNTLFFAGEYSDLVDRSQWVVVRYGPVRDWDGQNLGPVDTQRRHFFEVIVDESLTKRVRKVARGEVL